MTDTKRHLYLHMPHPHTTHHAAARHEDEQASAGFNQRIAVRLTTIVGSMSTAYSFILLALIGLAGILGWLPPVALVLVAWFSQTFLQLVLLPVISVGQNVLGRKAEIQADEAYKFTINSYHDIEQVMAHLDMQDQKIVEILEKIDKEK